nr:hypothetical protein BSM_16960 [uncultured archaeon]
MNITDVFFNNGQLNWGAISTISNIILVGVLVYITWRYAKQVKKQTGFMKIDRLVKEMDKLVAPLYSKIGDKVIFQKGAPGYRDSALPSDQGYFRFWDEIKQTKYLGPDYLRSAMDNYLRNKLDKVGDRTRDASYEKAEAELFEAIKKRYSELENELSILRKKS